MTEKRQPKFFYGYVVVASSFLILLLSYGILYTFGVFFKPVLTEFGWTRAMIAGAFSLSCLFNGIGSVVLGKLTDRFGPRMVVVACGFFSGLGSLLVSQVSTIWQLYLFYGVMIGTGLGVIAPLLSTVAKWFVKRRGLMTGIAVSGIGAGTLIIPPIANWLISNYSWRTSYTIVGIAVLVLIVLAAQFLRRDPSQMGLSPYGGNEVKRDSLNLGAGGFSLREAIHTRQFWLLSAICLCAGIIIQVSMVHIVIHAIGLGISGAIAAVILAIIGGASIAGRIITGSAADRIGNNLAFRIVLILMVVGYLWLQVAKELWMLYLFAVIFGFAYGGIICMMSPLTAELFGLRSLGVLLGLVNLNPAIGGAIGPVLAGRIFDITGSYHLAFIVCIAVGVIAVILAILMRPIYRQAGTNSLRT